MAQRAIEFAGIFIAMGVTYATLSTKVEALRKELDTEIIERKEIQNTHVRMDLFVAEMTHLRDQVREVRQEIADTKIEIRKFK